MDTKQLVIAPRIQLALYVKKYEEEMSADQKQYITGEVYVPESRGKSALQVLAFQYYLHQYLFDGNSFVLYTMGNYVRPPRETQIVGWPQMAGNELLEYSIEDFKHYCKAVQVILRGCTGAYNWASENLIYSNHNVKTMNKSELVFMATEFYVSAPYLICESVGELPPTPQKQPELSESDFDSPF